MSQDFNHSCSHRILKTVRISREAELIETKEQRFQKNETYQVTETPNQKVTKQTYFEATEYFENSPDSSSEQS